MVPDRKVMQQEAKRRAAEALAMSIETKGLERAGWLGAFEVWEALSRNVGRGDFAVREWARMRKAAARGEADGCDDILAWLAEQEA